MFRSQKSYTQVGPSAAKFAQIAEGTVRSTCVYLLEAPAKVRLFSAGMRLRSTLDLAPPASDVVALPSPPATELSQREDGGESEPYPSRALLTAW